MTDQAAPELSKKGKESSYITHARRRSLHVIMQHSVQARADQIHLVSSLQPVGKNHLSTSHVPGVLSIRPDQSPQLNEGVHDQSDEIEGKFKELMAQQMDLLNFHKRQFESVLDSELDSSYLPEQVKALITNGLQGIRHYLAILDTITQSFTSVQKDAVFKQLMALEMRLDTCRTELA